MNGYNRKFPDLDINIRAVQKVELEILLEFDGVCKENNIKYHLFAGTLLGAIRHNGFIPWDDDIDVCMLRGDFEKFLTIGQECLGKDYFLQTYETDKNYINQFAKIRKNNTIFLQRDVVGTDIHQGFYIDIFPFDNVEPHTFVGKIQRNILNILRYMTLCRLKEKVNKTKNSFDRYVKLFVHYFIKIIPKKPMDKVITKIACMFNNKNTEYVGDLSYSTAKDLYDRFTVKKSIFYDSISGNACN
jgi:lipopolysaccharide cholinephosphotransferase